jgi:hypothetical protein
VGSNKISLMDIVNQHKELITYSKIVFYPIAGNLRENGKEMLNLFSGFAHPRGSRVLDKKTLGSDDDDDDKELHSNLLGLLYQWMFLGNPSEMTSENGSLHAKTKFKLFLDLLAYMLQNPEKRLGIVPVCIGQEDRVMKIILDWIGEKVIGNNWYLQGNAKQVQKKKEKVSALWKKYLVVCDIENGKEMKDLSSLIFDDKVNLYTGVEETKVENFANWILLAKDQKPFEKKEKFVFFDCHFQQIDNEVGFVEKLKVYLTSELAACFFQYLLERSVCQEDLGKEIKEYQLKENETETKRDFISKPGRESKSKNTTMSKEEKLAKLAKLAEFVDQYVMDETDGFIKDYPEKNAPCADMIEKINDYFKRNDYTVEVDKSNMKNILVNILGKFIWKRSAEVGRYILKPE